MDVIGGWIDSNTTASQVQDNQLFIAGANVNIKRAVSAYLGAKKDNTPILAFSNVLVFSEGQAEEAWGVQVEETNVTANQNHAVMTGGKTKYFGGVAHVRNGFEMTGSNDSSSSPSVTTTTLISSISNNRTTMTGGETETLYGVYKNAASHMVLSGDTTNNTLEIYGGQVTGEAYGVITNASGTYANNAVNVQGDNTNTEIISSLHGIYFEPINNNVQVVDTAFNRNTVTVNNANIGLIHLNETNSKGKFSFDDNKLQLTDAKSGAVYGISVGALGQVNKIENTEITLENSTLESLTLIQDSTTSSAGEITGNFVKLLGTSTVTGTLSFVNSQSGNIHDNGLSAQGVHTVGTFAGKFDTLKLTVSELNNSTSGAPVLTLTTGDLDLSNIDITINNLDGINADESYKLVHTAGGTIHVDAGTVFKTEGTLFTEKTWTFTKDFDKNTLTTGDFLKGDDGDSEIIPDVTPNDNSHTLSDSILGSVAVINQGASFVANEGLAAMESASNVDQSGVFGTIGGGKTRYDTGSRVDVDSMSLVTGLVTRVTPELMVAGFVEAGFGNSESSTNNATAEGSHDYYGVGLASRYRFNLPFYIDGSLRLGTASTEFSGKYAEDSAKYSADGLYGSAHVGLGYVFDLADKLSLDVYGRYIFTYLEGDSVSLDTPDHERLESEDTTTHTMQIGALLRGMTTENIAWRFGLEYEHVADGDAESNILTKTDRIALNVPTLKGDSGIVNLGITMRSTPTDPMALDLGFKGYVGDHRGVSGTVTWSYMF